MKLDYEKAARIVLEEFRNGKIGRITLEYPDGANDENDQ